MGKSVRVNSHKAPPQFIRRPCPQCGYPERTMNGAYLAWKREQAGLSQREFGAALGISSPYLSDIETNRRACPQAIRAEYLRLK